MSLLSKAAVCILVFLANLDLGSIAIFIPRGCMSAGSQGVRGTSLGIVALKNFEQVAMVYQHRGLETLVLSSCSEQNIFSCKWTSQTTSTERHVRVLTLNPMVMARGLRLFAQGRAMPLSIRMADCSLAGHCRLSFLQPLAHDNPLTPTP